MGEKGIRYKIIFLNVDSICLFMMAVMSPFEQFEYISIL